MVSVCEECGATEQGTKELSVDQKKRFCFDELDVVEVCAVCEMPDTMNEFNEDGEDR